MKEKIKYNMKLFRVIDSKTSEILYYECRSCSEKAFFADKVEHTEGCAFK